MIKTLKMIAETLQDIYTELYKISDAIYSLQIIAELLSENKKEGD